MTTADPYLPTNNEAWGFWGTIDRHEGADAPVAWLLASHAVACATGCTAEAVRDFLDGRHGRHLADDVTNGLAAGRTLAQAIAAAVERWMGWRIGKQVEREEGIPRGLPHLTGFVTLYEILAEAAD